MREFQSLINWTKDIQKRQIHKKALNKTKLIYFFSKTLISFIITFVERGDSYERKKSYKKRETRNALERI